MSSLGAQTRLILRNDLRLLWRDLMASQMKNFLRVGLIVVLFCLANAVAIAVFFAFRRAPPLGAEQDSGGGARPARWLPTSLLKAGRFVPASLQGVARARSGSRASEGSVAIGLPAQAGCGIASGAGARACIFMRHGQRLAFSGATRRRACVQNMRGRIAYVNDIDILRPADPAKANGILFFHVVKRATGSSSEKTGICPR